MNVLIDEINHVELVERHINESVLFLTNCYMKNISVIYPCTSQYIAECPYNLLLHRLIQNIQFNHKDKYLDIRTLMSYVDYYYDIE